MKRYSIFKRIVAGIGMITLLSGSLGINTNAVFADAPAAVTAADGTSVSTAADAATDPNAANGVQAPGADGTANAPAADDGANTPATSDPSNAGQNGQGNTALTSLTASMDGITVTASFDAGTFPDGTVLSLSGVSEEMLNAASEAASAEAKANGETASTVKEVRGVDITFAEGGTGAVLQPADGRSVQITMSGVFAGIESNQAVKLYHFASANPEAAAASVENGNITFTGTSFSPFVPVLLEPAAKEASLDASLLGSNGKAMESGSTLKLTDFRGKSGALTAALTLEENSSNHKLIYKLPEWFSWYEVKDDPNGAYKVTVSTDPNTKYGSNNILEVQFPDTSEAEGKEFSFSFRLNEDSMPDEYIKELQQNGFEEMVFSVEQQWTASDGTVKSTEPTVITEGYQWTLPKDPTYYFGEWHSAVWLGLIGNLYVGGYGTHTGAIQQGIYDSLNGNTTLKNNNRVYNYAVIPSNDVFSVGAVSVKNVELKVVDDHYKIIGVSKPTGATKYDDYTFEISEDGKTVICTPKEGSEVYRNATASTSNLVNLVLGFDFEKYDRDTWSDGLNAEEPIALWKASESTNRPYYVKMLSTQIHYNTFGENAESGYDSKINYGSRKSAPYRVLDPGVALGGSNTSRNEHENAAHGDDILQIAWTGDAGGTSSDGQWLSQYALSYANMNYEGTLVYARRNATGMRMESTYPYEMRSVNFDIRPQYKPLSSTLEDEFTPGGYELDYVEFTLSNGQTIKVGPGGQFADRWEAAKQPNSKGVIDGKFTLTNEDLGLPAEIGDEAADVRVTKITQYYKDAPCSIYSNNTLPKDKDGVPEHAAVICTKWNVTTLEEDGKTPVGTAPLTHKDGAEGVNRWYPINVNLYRTYTGDEIVSADFYNLQIKEAKDPEFTIAANAEAGKLLRGNGKNAGWYPYSNNVIANGLDIRLETTDLEGYQKVLTNPVFAFYGSYGGREQRESYTGKITVTPAMADWTATYTTQTAQGAKDGAAAVRKTVTFPSKEDFANSANVDENGNITIDLLTDDEYFVDQGGDLRTHVYNSGTSNTYLVLSYEGNWDYTDALEYPGRTLATLECIARESYHDGTYGIKLCYDGGYNTRFTYKWDNCTCDRANHMAHTTAQQALGNATQKTVYAVDWKGAEIFQPQSAPTTWEGKIVQGTTTTLTGNLVLNVNNLSWGEWHPSGDVLYLELADKDVSFRGNASIDGYEDPDAHIETINGKRYLVIRDNSPEDTVKPVAQETGSSYGNAWYSTHYQKMETMVVKFDIYTKPTAQVSSEKENIKNGGNPYKSRVLAVLLYRFVACLSLKSTNRY